MSPCSRYPVKTARDVASKEFDYVVIGGGTAGCVLASRLSENLKHRTLLVERGPVIDGWLSNVPLVSSNFSDQKAPVYKWQSTPLKGLGGKSLTLVTGKALGGSTKMNGLIYSRSVPGEYNAWEQAGRKNWGWQHVEPFFKKSEDSLSHGHSLSRGNKGPWQNQSVKKEHFESVRTNIKIAVDHGIPLVKEANDPAAPAVVCTPLDATIDRDKHRCSTDVAFLPRSLAAERENLFICVETLCTSLDVKHTDDGQPRVVGVYLEADSDATERYHVSVTKEAILCAGAIATPQLLLLSGIGPEQHLKQVGVPVLKNLPGVGFHLQDHISVPLVFKTPLDDSIEVLMGKPLTAVGQFLKYIFSGKGILGQQVQQANIVLRSALLDDSSQLHSMQPEELDGYNPLNIPDIEIMFLPVNTTGQQFDGLAKSFGGFSYLCSVLRPKSFGSVQLNSLDPRQQPLSDVGTLSDEEDRVPIRKALRLALTLAAKVRASGYPLEDLLVPASADDKVLDDFVRDNIMSTYHYSCSCRMDDLEQMGVVDDELRVHGVRGLRIADASVFPEIPACHLQAPVVMIAERCAQFILDQV
ncbi:GMC oxidoreductase [Dendrothele bispora CBS 962.96]|uniref:GMC oxidoreductase n=1 Tax=Dendrothele bispora (strain CBS 962.96) TaxID=1314807 RepID=A0A4S8LLL6_DENBC|nr:GMC oxidoreductase [Dendrothele bispora CBS 962.96]